MRTTISLIVAEFCILLHVIGASQLQEDCLSFHHPVRCHCISSSSTDSEFHVTTTPEPSFMQLLTSSPPMASPPSVLYSPVLPSPPLSIPSNTTQEEAQCKWQSLPIGFCLSFNASTCIGTTGMCPYVLKLSDWIQYEKIGYIKILVSNCSAINGIVCGPLHREGLLCSRCMHGYGLALYARSWHCVKCKDGHTVWRWVLYVALELISLVLFYLMVVVFDVQVATPPYTGYVFYCQLLTQLFRSSAYIRMQFEAFSTGTLRIFSLTIIDIWNLDFFRRVFPAFCVSSEIGNVESILLEFATALFPLFLVVVTYIVIELHARDCRIIVKTWRPFHRYFVGFRRTWNPKASIINAFATFMLLSLSKLIFLSFYSTVFIDMFHSNHTYYEEYRHRLLIDPHKMLIQLLGLTVSLFTILLSLVLLPSLLVVLYPLKCLRKVVCCRCLYRSQALWIFMEAFQGHYRGGTESSAYSFRGAAVLQFINRIALSLVWVNIWKRYEAPTIRYFYIIVSYLIALTLFYLLARPYNKAYMNNIEGFLYGLAAILVLSIISMSLYMQPHYHLKPRGNNTVYADVLLVAMVMPSLVLLAIVWYRLICRVVMWGRRRMGGGGGVAREEEGCSEGLPHRLQ